MDKETLQELKKAAGKVAERFKIDPVTAAKIVGSIREDRDQVSRIMGGDFSTLPAAAKKLGYTLPETVANGPETHGPKVSPKGQKKGKKEKKKEDGERIEKIEGEIVEYKKGELPENVPSLVMDVIDSYCEQNHIDDLSKERQPRWGAACYMVGQTVFKKSKILHDIQKEKIQGGIRYDVERVTALVDLWGVLCQTFCKAPLIDDFARFAALSDSWLYGAGSQDALTPERTLLLQKLKRMQESGLSSMIVDGRQNPTGALAALNHWHGWTQQREIIHTTGAAVANAQALPILNASAGILTDGGGNNGSES